MRVRDDNTTIYYYNNGAIGGFNRSYRKAKLVEIDQRRRGPKYGVASRVWKKVWQLLKKPRDCCAIAPCSKARANVVSKVSNIQDFFDRSYIPNEIEVP